MEDAKFEKVTLDVIKANSDCSNPRIKFVFSRLLTHLHAFVSEVRLSTNEWQTGLDFLVAVGQISSALRGEMILLSDVLGLSMLVDSIDNGKDGQHFTEGTVLGPFHTLDAPHADNGYVLHHDPGAERLFVHCSVKDSAGEAIGGVTCDVWEGDSHGFYDVQNPNRVEPDGRAVLKSSPDGIFYFNAVVPVPYPIPDDGPVGGLLKLLGRHPNRPAHIHFMLQKEGYDRLTTALYPVGGRFLDSDPVFGVKDSLLVSLDTVSKEIGEKYGAKEGTAMLSYNFVLATEEEAMGFRVQQAREAMGMLGFRGRIENGLPIPDVD